MMGMPSLKANGKLFAGQPRRRRASSSSAATITRAALALEGAHLFEPMAGRQMKEWVVVPNALRPNGRRLAEAALQYAGGKLMGEVLERRGRRAEVKVSRDEIVVFEFEMAPETTAPARTSTSSTSTRSTSSKASSS